MGLRRWLESLMGVTQTEQPLSPQPLLTLDEVLRRRPEPGYALDFEQKTVTGPSRSYGLSDLEEVLALDVGYGIESHVALKVKRGPIFSVYRFDSRPETLASGKQLALRLGLGFVDCTESKRASILDDACAVLGDGDAMMLASLERADFWPGAVSIPVAVQRPEPYPPSADLVLSVEGISLINALGKTRPLRPLQDLVAFRSCTANGVQGDRDTYGYDLELEFAGGPTYRLYSSAGSVHDDPIPGEQAEAYRMMDVLKKVCERIPLHLNLK